MKEKNTLGHTKLWAFRCLILRPKILNLMSQNQIRGKLLTLAVSHNVLYYQQHPITRYQVRFYANNYFE